MRTHLKINKWLLFGGSWGSTLALTYAITYPENVEGLILRGIFLCRTKDLNWFYQSGADHIFPDFWEEFITPIPPEKRGNILQAFYDQLLEQDKLQRIKATKAWSMWSGKTYKLTCDDLNLDDATLEAIYPSTLLECHYLLHRAFFNSDNWILENIDRIKHLRCTIIHGRYDMLCPMQNAWDLHRAWPNSKLKIIPGAGHSSSEPGILDALIQATDNLITITNKQQGEDSSPQH